MKLEGFKFPESSFLSVEKDMRIIINYLCKNENLKKLLYYPTKDCLDRPNLTDDETLSLFNNQIRMVPKLKIDGSLMDYVIVSFDNFLENNNNPEFRDNVVEFDVICHFDTWQLTDFKLRPYRIAAEIDSMLNNQKLTGLGKLQFLGANQMILTDEFAGLCLMYQTIHGEEDKKFTDKKEDWEKYVNNFNDIFNNK